MSILITGMEMPKSCGDCPCLSETYCCCVDGVYPYDCNILIQDTEEGSEFIGRLSNCPLVEVPKWIPVTERLPEDRNMALATVDGVVRIAFYGNYMWEEIETYSIFYPTHWMPLPQPPKDGEA